MQTARQILLCVLFCQRYSFLLCSCKFDFSLCLSFSLPPSVFLFPSAFVFISLVLLVLSGSLFDTHTHTHKVKLSLWWLSLLFGLSVRSPPLCSLLFSVCFVVLCMEAEMQIECRQFALGEDFAHAPLGICLTKHIHLFTHDRMDKTPSAIGAMMKYFTSEI